jgi:hypothetical protein
MRIVVVLLFAALLSGCAARQAEPPVAARDAQAKVPPVAYHSAFEGYRPFADQELADWRRANEEVGAAGGHAGHKPGQGPGQATSKPQPGGHH